MGLIKRAAAQCCRPLLLFSMTGLYVHELVVLHDKGTRVSCPPDDASLSSLPCAPIISYLPKHTVIVKGSRCIAALDVGGKDGNKLRRKRLSLQGILRDGSQRFSFCFPHPIHRNADAALYVENAGVILSGNCRVQPPFSKWRPGRLPGHQVDSIRNVKKARVFRR